MLRPQAPASLIHVLLDEPGDGDRVVLEGGIAHHVGRVLRARAGEAFTTSDGRGVIGRGVVAEVAGDKVVLEMHERQVMAPSPFRIRVLLPLLSGVRTAWAVEKVVEAGADAVSPVLTRRGARPPSAPTKLRERLQSIARAATEQSRRAYLPAVDELMPLADALSRGGETIVCADTVDCVPVSAALAGLSGPGAALLTGPEGGFDDSERTLLDDAGAVRVTLGPHVLRAETAPVVLVGIVAFAVGILDAAPQTD